MIFLGDIAHPFSVAPVFGDVPWDSSDIVIANLEGPITNGNEELLASHLLFNDYSILRPLVDLGAVAVCLANNHSTDIEGGLEDTVAILNQKGIQCFGGGENLTQAGKPAAVYQQGRKYLLLGFGWETIQCRAAGVYTPGVNPLRPSSVLSAVEYYSDLEPEASLIVSLHWNYEMEAYPQPAHRQLAREIISAGASAVIGHHPHCVGGIELFDGKPVVYSLGNWWLPQNTFFGGKLKYEERSLLQLAVGLNHSGEVTCYWFKYNREHHRLEFLGSEALSESRRASELTPFDGMSDTDYIRWFKVNRLKRKCLPIYRDYRSTISNRCRDRYIRIRHMGIVMAKKIASRGNNG